jgi:hypothetical protein
MASAKPKLSAPFVNRELNGELLIEELADLRTGMVQERTLVDCAQCVSELVALGVEEARRELRTLSRERFAHAPALATLMTQWAGRLRLAPDVPKLVGHFERLSTTLLLLSALKRGAPRLGGQRS